MNAAIQSIVAGAAVLAALAWATSRLVAGIRGRKVSCCGDSTPAGRGANPCAGCRGCGSDSACH